MMRFIVFIIFALATWRVVSMLVRERGPLDMFVWIRTRAGIEHDENKVPYMIPDSLLAGILSCTWCCSMWVALGWVGFWLVLPLWAEKIATVFAVSAAVILIDKWIGS